MMTKLALARAEEQALLSMSNEQICAGVRAGDPVAIRALKAQISDFVDSDPMLQDFSRQMRRGDGQVPFKMHGSATWAPVRGEGDWSQWGPWEVWEECEIGALNGGTAVGRVPTGAWIVWDSASGQRYGTPPGGESRPKAYKMARLLNGGRPTRVVPMTADAFALPTE